MLQGNGVSPDGRRRHPRLFVPAIVLAPTIPDFPVEAENISAGGFMASFSEPPDADTLHDAVILLPGAAFRGCRARVVWRTRKESPMPRAWASGLSFLMEDREQDRLWHALEALAKGG